ncbi:MAG: hypothetical protein KDK36_17980 [Leptospiraceae bacterium]|nr:hypothetical protein [Leptospiraceae bacterium]
MGRSLTMKKINLNDYEIDIPNELKSLLPGFVRRRFDDLQSLNFYLKSNQCSEISKIAHKIVGHGAGYGFTALSELGALIEINAKSESIEEINFLIHNFEEVINEIKIKYL